MKPKKVSSGNFCCQRNRFSVLSESKTYIARVRNCFKTKKIHNSLDKAGITNGETVSFICKGSLLLAVGSPVTNVWVNLRSGCWGAFTELKL